MLPDYEIDRSELMFFIVSLSTGLIVGLIIVNIIFPRLRKWSAVRKMTSLRIALNTVNRYIIPWTTFLGIYVFLIYTDIENPLIDDTKSVADFILILSVIFVIGKILTGIASFYVRRGKLPNTTIFGNIIRFIIFIILVGLILNFMGIGIDPVVATFGIGAIAIALALQDTLSNLFAGIYIIAVRQINPEDYVRLNSGEEGYIADINWRNTTIRSIQNNLVIIPNNVLAGSILTNYNLPNKEMTIRIPIGVAYESDLEHVEKVCISTAKEVIKEFKYTEEFEPHVRYHTFGDFSINFNLVVKILEFRQQFEIQHNVIKAIHKNFAKEGINIPFPIRRIYQKDD